MPRAGVAATLIAMGVLYFVVMSAGAFGFRTRARRLAAAGLDPADATSSKAHDHARHVHLDKAWKTPQFWLIWAVLCLNVTRRHRRDRRWPRRCCRKSSARCWSAPPARRTDHGGQKAAIVAAAAGLVGLISLFNSLGRLFWASVSDRIGRKKTYIVFFVLGIILYCAMPTLGHMGAAGLFVIAVCVILTMYGGGFSTVPAYLADIFGTQMVGAIHGRLLTAWSAAGIIGPVLIANMREAQLQAGVPSNLVYDRTLYILAGLLLVGLICNLLIKPGRGKELHDRERARSANARCTRSSRGLDANAQSAAAARSARRRAGVARGRRAVPDRRLDRAVEGRGAVPLIAANRSNRAGDGTRTCRRPFFRVSRRTGRDRARSYAWRGRPRA